MVFLIQASEEMSKMPGRDGIWHVVAKAVVCFLYFDEYRDEETSQTFAKVVYVSSLTLGTDFHGNSSLTTQRRIMCNYGCR